MESGLLGEEQSEPAPLLPHFQYRKHSRTENLSIRLPKLKMPTVPCVNYCSLIGYWSGIGAHFWTWSKSRIILNITGVKKQFCREDFCPKTWKFYKDNLSWEMFPQKPQQGTWMFRLTSAEEVHAPGSRCGICGKDPTLSSGQAPEETEALSNSAHGSKLHSHGSSEVFPGGEEQSSTIPNLGGVSDCLHPKCHT